MTTWDKTKHPRGGNKKNAGQFSSTWGPKAQLAQREKYARKYAKVAERRYDRVLNSKKYAGRADSFKRRLYQHDDDAARAKYYQLQQTRKFRKLTETEKRQMQVSRKRMTDSDPQAKFGASLASFGYGGAYVASYAGAGSTAILGAGAVGAAGSMVTAHALARGKSEMFGAKGFKRDGVLSEAETNALSSAFGAVSMAGVAYLDTKTRMNVGRLLASKVARGSVVRNVRPMARPSVTMNWSQGLGVASADPWRQFAKVAKANGSRLDDYQLQKLMLDYQDDIRRHFTTVFKTDHQRFIMRYHGNPFKDGAPRTFQFDAAKALDIEEPLMSHFQLGGAVNALYANAGDQKKAIEMMQYQYKATQRLLADAGIESINVTRGMALGKGAAKDFKISPVQSLTPQTTPWSQADVRLQPLNSFSMSPAMAVDYATNSVGGGGQWGSGNIALILRGKVPREQIFGFTGFGPGHGSEIIVKGGWLKDLEMMMIDPNITRFQRITGNMGQVGRGAQANSTARSIERLWDWGMKSSVNKAYSAFGIQHGAVYV